MLATNATETQGQAQAGLNNLYELHWNGSQWVTTFIATLSGGDSAEWEGNRTGDTAFLTARASPNGRYLAFMSQASLTGYDNVDASPAAKGARAQEVYLYDAEAATLRCISCNPSGGRPVGVLDANESGEGLGLLVDRRQVWLGHWLAGDIPGWTARSLVTAQFQSRYLTNDGRTYFDSPDRLVPAAKNGRENVYEYEPSGAGSCVSDSGGCLALVSAASSDRESAFMEASPNGSNVFFLTQDRLLPQDTDTAFDIYDARECGSAGPCLTAPVPSAPGCDRTETCRPAEPGAEVGAAPSGTVVFSGPGNRPAAPAAQHATQAAKATKVHTRTRAQKLAAALKTCRKRHRRSPHKRELCERAARRRYRARKPRKPTHAAGRPVGSSR